MVIIKNNHKENGKKIKQMEMENFGMLTVIYLKANGWMIKQTDTECIYM